MTPKNPISRLRRLLKEDQFMHAMDNETRRGTVYSMTNEAANNQVMAFRRGHNGRLTRTNAYSTGGSGTGSAVVDPLSSQGSLILSPDGRRLFAVNAGSNSIASFRVADSGALSLVDVEPSGGILPNSLTLFGDLLYVSNVGQADQATASNITGFRIKRDGRLTRITGSTRPLSTANAKPSCIIFSPDGRLLVVSELATNRLSVFRVNKDGTLSGPTSNNSSGAGPFGSVFLSSGILLVSESGPNALSSYTASLSGKLTVISASVRNGQAATCWVSVSRDERFAYTSNAGSGTISIYRVKDNGRLALMRLVYSTIDEISAPLDSGVSGDGNNFYVLNGNQGSISVFAVQKGSRLVRLQVLRDTGLPVVGAQGLAVR